MKLCELIDMLEEAACEVGRETDVFYSVLGPDADCEWEALVTTVEVHRWSGQVSIVLS